MAAEDERLSDPKAMSSHWPGVGRRFTTPLVAAVVAATLFSRPCPGDDRSPAPDSPPGKTREPRDIVVYGGSAAAVIAAVQAKRMGKSAIVVSPDNHLGGLSSGGLGWTDTGNKAVIGGLARDFYHRVWKHYERPEAWRWQTRAAFGNRGQGHAASDGEAKTMWVFEPHVAERIFEDLVAEHEIDVVRDEWLDRERGVRKDGARVVSITTLTGNTYPGRCSSMPPTRAT